MLIIIIVLLPLKAQVWAEALNETDLGKLLAVVGQLPIFSSGASPDRFKKIEALLSEEQRIRRLTWIFWPAMVLTGAWFVDRFCRGGKGPLLSDY